jgi:hypothetical protein
MDKDQITNKARIKAGTWLEERREEEGWAAL